MKTNHACGQVYEVANKEELKDALTSANDPIIVGGGSNILFVDDTDRDLIVINILGKEIVEETEYSVTIRIGAGVDWHELVLWTIDQDFGGIENLSLIPGKCGAVPMQNIGAYGVEIRDVLQRVEMMDRTTYEISTLSNEECQFGYRDSIFKNELRDKVVITGIDIKLAKPGYYRTNVTYGAIGDVLMSQGIHQPTIKEVSDAVILIRQSKLPDPKEIPNCGSFFKNPIVPESVVAHLQIEYPNIPFYKVPEEGFLKIPAGWLIEQAGLKGKKVGRVGTHDRQALVVINHDGGTGKEVYDFATDVQSAVEEKFGIIIYPEVNLYP